MSATRRQVYICCHIVIDAVLSGHLQYTSAEALAREAKSFGTHWGVTYEQCLEALTKPMHEVCQWDA